MQNKIKNKIENERLQNFKAGWCAIGAQPNSSNCLQATNE